MNNPKRSNLEFLNPNDLDKELDRIQPVIKKSRKIAFGALAITGGVTIGNVLGVIPEGPEIFNNVSIRELAVTSTFFVGTLSGISNLILRIEENNALKLLPEH